MQCPRCQAAITTKPDPGGFLICSSCKTRLMVKQVAKPRADVQNPSLTLPPGTPAKKIPRPVEDAPRAPGPAPTPKSAAQAPTTKNAAAPVATPEAGPSPLDAVLAELGALRRGQEEVLQILRGHSRTAAPTDGSFDALDDYEPALLPPVRSHQRKSVLIIDDDDATREASLAELRAAEIPARGCREGGAAIEDIAKEKPDIIVLELDLAGKLAGKDVINMIKATMEWVDIPILLYTRAEVESQKEARQIHGADDVVLKSSGPSSLVSKIVSLFRRG